MTVLPSPDSYTIGWIAALPIERAAAMALLDDEHEQPKNFEQNRSDANSYTWGRMGNHNVVIASLPLGVYGVTSSAITASHLLASLPHIRIGLLVGIGGGIARPDIDQDIRLGDVVVSKPEGTSGGVVQYDLGKAKLNNKWELKGALNKPPPVLLGALSHLEAVHETNPSKILDILNAMWAARPLMKKGKKQQLSYVHQGSENDRLFLSSYEHNTTKKTCEECDLTHCMEREVRETTQPEIHYGIIASGNTLVKDAVSRDEIAQLVGDECMCVEMEAAGLMDQFPCVVIRGICDYADSHKNDRWQRYAAATAAAYAKELLGYVSPQQLQNTDKAADIKSIKEGIEDIKTTTLSTLATSLAIQEDSSKIPQIHSAVKSLTTTEQREQTRRITEWLAPIDFSKTQSSRHDLALEDTGKWFLNCDTFQNWIKTPGATLWCPGTAGAGKTTLMSLAVASLVQQVQSQSSTKVACVYCNYKEKETHDPISIIAWLWRQLIGSDTQHSEDVQKLWDDHLESDIGLVVRKNNEVVNIMEKAIERNTQTFLLVDGLDEVPENARGELVRVLKSLQTSGKCNILVTSRPFPSIQQLFQDDPVLEISAQNEDLYLYIKAQMRTGNFETLQKRIPRLEQTIVGNIIPKCENTFLLATLYMKYLANAESVNSFKAAIQNLPKGLDDLYSDAMERIKYHGHGERAMQVLFWVTFATRPLSTRELSHALAINTGDTEYDEDNELLLDFTSICSALVLIDPLSNVVRLSHFTTEEYLKQEYGKWFPGIFEYLTSRMLTYLSFGVFQKPLPNGYRIEDLYHQFPLLHYAALNWGNHLKDVSSSSNEVKKQALDFLRQEFRLSDTITKRHFENVLQEHRFQGEVCGRITSLHLAVLFNLTEFVPYLHAHEQENPTTEPFAASPLNIACKMDRVEMARLLLETGADVHGTPGFAWRPIHQAAMAGKSAELITLLLDSGARIEERVTQDPTEKTKYNHIYGQTPLLEAAWHNNVETARVLLQRRADMFSPGITFNDTPLEACRENAPVLSVFFDSLEDVTDKRLIQPLIRSKSGKLVESMIRRGFDVNQQCNYGKTSLDHAIEYGNDEVIAVLVENGAKPGHNWIQQQNIARFSSQPWFQKLQHALADYETDTPVKEGQSHAFGEMVWDPELKISTHSPIIAQVEVLITDDMNLPIQAIEFRTESHDQGWSDTASDKGTYNGSCTWFEVRIKYPPVIESKDDEAVVSNNEASYSAVTRIQHNLTATWTATKHINIWDRDYAFPHILDILDQVQKGCTVEFIARAHYRGWVNYVRSMRVDVFGRKLEEHI